MKVFFVTTLFLFVTLLQSFAKKTNPVFLTGHIKFRNPQIIVRTMLIVVRGDHKILARANANAKGNFTITFTPKKERSFKFYCSAPAIGTKLMGIIKTFESDTPEITFYIPRESKSK